MTEEGLNVHYSIAAGVIAMILTQLQLYNTCNFL